ncbi:flagellar protein FlgN [Rubellimicrobium aerolatum]|uniref:Flagellar biosynthesis protein FlgN n=1 Tax=Rubellimicrobium aerolatum TaxID=490979 RepID=A0ABW0S9U2_9RHOB|nr:flagellar protein FlgN [Rubellimicrobium aerolatum]MBP1805059.1 hypothetical protein [Rubellimicrobium aerolatum]
MRPEPLPDLALLLEEERRLILAGAWDGLQALAPRKAAGLAALPREGGAALAPLARGLARNQALLSAALDGVREAVRRRAAMATMRRGLVTYDAQGLRAELPTAPPRIERKA